MDIIRVKNLVKRYGNGALALNGLSLTVKEGEIFSLLGQNGAGKSTLIGILSTYLRPTSGVVEMLGKNVLTESAAVRSCIACVAQKTSIDAFLSLKENMMFQSRLYHIPRTQAVERMEALISTFGLERYLDYPVASYSGGVKRRLDIALNLMSGPKILFLDEPTVGMDIQSRQAMWEMMKRIRESFGVTIFLTTHYLEEADQLSDTICIMREGKEAAQGSPEQLRSYLKQKYIKISFDKKEAAQAAKEQIQQALDVKSVDAGGKDRWLLIPAADQKEDLSRTARFLLGREIAFTGIEILQPAIEDIFIRLTSGEEARQ